MFIVNPRKKSIPKETILNRASAPGTTVECLAMQILCEHPVGML